MHNSQMSNDREQRGLVQDALRRLRLERHGLPQGGLRSLGLAQHGALLALLALMLLGGTALAAEAEPIDTSVASMLSSPSVRLATPVMPAAPVPGQPTQPSVSERWLRLQSSGGAASQHAQSATAAEQELANQRFLDSYQYPIPEWFFEDSTGGSGGSGN